MAVDVYGTLIRTLFVCLFAYLFWFWCVEKLTKQKKMQKSFKQTLMSLETYTWNHFAATKSVTAGQT